MSFRESGPRPGSYRPVIAIAFIIMAVIVAAPGSAVLSQEVKDQKPKKPRFEKQELTLTDNVAGLMWTVSGYPGGQQLSWNNAFAYIDKMNREKYAGYRNWRMPSKEELMTLVASVKGQGFDGSMPDKTVATGLSRLGFQQVQEGGYWSSTEYFYFEANAWIVDMTAGSVSAGEKTLYYSIWPVRSAR